jgi:hypothetical protein
MKGQKFEGGGRQGCVIASLLFNIYTDFVVKRALAQIPDGCGVSYPSHATVQMESYRAYMAVWVLPAWS